MRAAVSAHATCASRARHRRERGFGPVRCSLGVGEAAALLGVAPGTSQAEVKSAFRRSLLRLHPDVNARESANADTRRLIAAYRLLSGSTSRVAGGAPLADVFRWPECEAEELFVNELRCVGVRRCSSSWCAGVTARLQVSHAGPRSVAAAPSTFMLAADTGAARVHLSGAGDDGDYALRCAVGQCPTNCIHYLTLAQLARVQAELERAKGGEVFCAGAELDSLLAAANYQNRRFSGASRGRAPW